MNARSALVLALAALFTLAACSSEPSQPARVTNYGPTPYDAPTAGDSWGSGSPDGRSAATAPRGPAIAGTVNWHYSLADAQAQARATGRLILVLSTKPRCSMCDKFKTKTAPAAAGELNGMAVGYIYDITRPGEAAPIDQVLRANLRGADLMPLVGFLTPDLRWVHGFWGARSVGEFRGDISTARRIHPVRTSQVVPPTRVGGPTLAVVNEFGEPEWSLPGDVWPDGDQQPIDAITGAPDVLAARAAAAPASAVVAAADPVAPPAPPAGLRAAYDDAPGMDAVVGATSPDRPAPPAEPTLAALPALPLPPSASSLSVPSPAAGAATPEASTPWSAPATDGAVADDGVGVAAPDAPPSTPEVTAADEPASDSADLDSWGRETLERARALIQAGQFAEARTTLTEVHERLPGTPLAREASKGGIALYNAKRIRLASNGAERTRYLSRARRDFSASMWGVLFDS